MRKKTPILLIIRAYKHIVIANKFLKPLLYWEVCFLRKNFKYSWPVSSASTNSIIDQKSSQKAIHLYRTCTDFWLLSKQPTIITIYTMYICILVGIISNIEIIYSIWKDVFKLYAYTIPF